MIDLLKIISAWREILILIVSVLIGYLIRWLEDKRRRTFEKEKEYREELRKYSTEIFEPLFKIASDIIQNLISLRDWYDGTKNLISNDEELNDNLEKLTEYVDILNTFIDENSTRIDMVLPSELGSMTFNTILIELYKIISDIYDDKSPTEKIQSTAITLIDVKSDIQKLLGYSTTLKLQTDAHRDRP